MTTPSDELQHIQFKGRDVCVIAPEDYDKLLADISRLTTIVDRLQRSDITRLYLEEVARGDGLAIKLERAQRDAGRYRWLRSHRSVLLVTGFFGNGCLNKTTEMVDAAIDAVMVSK